MRTAVLDTATCPLAELTQHIRDTHHGYLRRELPVIADLLKEASAARLPAADEARALARIFRVFRSTIENHLTKEEVVLFPFVERLERSLGIGEPPPAYAFGPLRLPIEILEGEHLQCDWLLDEMRPQWVRWSQAEDPPGLQRRLCERLLALDADMRRHTHVEDDVLFPRTIALEDP